MGESERLAGSDDIATHSELGVRSRPPAGHYSWELLVTAVILAAVGGATLGFFAGPSIAGGLAEVSNPSGGGSLNLDKLTRSISVPSRVGQEQAVGDSIRSFGELESRGGGSGNRRRVVKVFYHVAAIGSFKEIVIEHMTRLIMSGVYERAEGIYCFIMGKSLEDIEEARSTVTGFGKKVKVVNTTLEMSLFERFTLEAIRNHVTEEDLILYFHTKGVTKPGNAFVFYWALYMHYFMLRRHEEVAELLQTYDTVGCQLLTEPKKHYSGNFWWARASYFLRLEPKIGPEYYDPEMYLGSGVQPLMYEMWKAQNQLFYTYAFVPSMYVDEDIDKHIMP